MSFLSELQRATELTRAGKLQEATRAIRDALSRRAGGTAAQPGQRADPRSATSRLRAYPPPGTDGDAGDVIDVEARMVPPGPPSTARREAPRGHGSPGAFSAHHLLIDGRRYRYRLYKPAADVPPAPMPLVVMLHGCKQDSEDFARGTAMNEVAAREGFLVLYPEQMRRSNSMGCWNWFEPAHQQRGAGEPAVIAGMVRQVMAAHGVDPDRVYVAGLSAGGAMAALMGELYPDLFAAVGVHSGLAARAAHGVTSAFRAMRNGSGARTPGFAKTGAAVPTIVFHSVDDKTVAARNGDTVVARQIAAHEAAGTLLRARQDAAGTGESNGREVARTTWVDAGGQVRLEKWSLKGAPHAWSGGDATGSFTDSAGPSASEAMVRFFLRHARR